VSEKDAPKQAAPQMPTPQQSAPQKPAPPENRLVILDNHPVKEWLPGKSGEKS